MKSELQRPAGGRLGRRAALARLGLGVAVAYTAPTVLHLDRSANAVVVPTPCPKGKGRGGPWCKTGSLLFRRRTTGIG